MQECGERRRWRRLVLPSGPGQIPNSRKQDVFLLGHVRLEFVRQFLEDRLDDRHWSMGGTPAVHRDGEGLAQGGDGALHVAVVPVNDVIRQFVEGPVRRTESREIGGIAHAVCHSTGRAAGGV